MRNRVFAVALFILSCSNESTDRPARMAVPSSAKDWNIVGITESVTSIGNPETTIVFQSTDTLRVPLGSVEHLATLVTKGGEPWVVLAGVECTECDASLGVVFVPVSATAAKPSHHNYAFPGALTECCVEEVTYRSRMFVGKCSEHGVGAVFLEEERDSAATWIKRTRVVKLEPRFSESVVPLTDQVISAYVQRGECREIPGREQTVM